MIDLSILRYVKYKANLDRLLPSLPADALDPKTMIILHDFDRYLKETGHPVVKMGAFKTVFFSFYHKAIAKDKDKAAYFSRLLDNCDKDIDVDTARQLNNHLTELSFATDVANRASEYHAGEDVDIINSVDMRLERAKANILTGDAKKLYHEDSIEDLLREDQNMEGLRFANACLRNNLRPMRTGDWILACGRTDAGKTSFLTSNLVSIVQQLPEDGHVLWLNNESTASRINKRLYNSFLGASSDELIQLSKKGNIRDMFAERGGNKIKIVDVHEWNTTMVERLIDDSMPKMVIYDMLDHIEFKGLATGGKHARTDQVLEDQYNWGRKLTVKYGHVGIATSQISAEVEKLPETQCWPPLHMLKDSRTGKQTTADLVIMIGKSLDPMCAGDRYLSAPKNKLGNGRGTNYIRESVNIDISRGLFIDPQ